MGIVDDFYLQPIILAKLKQRKFWQENAPDGRYRYDHIAALLIHGFSWTVMMLTPLWWYGLLPSGWMFVTAIAANTIIHAQVASCRDAPLGRKPLPLAFASRRDAPLGAERGIPTGCHDFFALFSTERSILTGCSTRPAYMECRGLPPHSIYGNSDRVMARHWVASGHCVTLAMTAWHSNLSQERKASALQYRNGHYYCALGKSLDLL